MYLFFDKSVTRVWCITDRTCLWVIFPLFFPFFVVLLRSVVVCGVFCVARKEKRARERFSPSRLSSYVISIQEDGEKCSLCWLLLLCSGGKDQLFISCLYSSHHTKKKRNKKKTPCHDKQEYSSQDSLHCTTKSTTHHISPHNSVCTKLPLNSFFYTHTHTHTHRRRLHHDITSHHVTYHVTITRLRRRLAGPTFSSPPSPFARAAPSPRS